jgi:hypothetical protein
VLVGRSLVGERERGSVDNGARYFFVEASRLGVVARGRRPTSSLLDVDSGRRGVAWTGLGGLRLGTEVEDCMAGYI